VKWTDAEDIGIALSEKFPEDDPLTVRFTDLRERVLQLDGFDDDAKPRMSPNSRQSRWPGTKNGKKLTESEIRFGRF
jgi:FeS assembly protein IscX